MEQKPFLTENEKLAAVIGGDSTSRVMAMDGTTADDVIKSRNIKKFNEEVDEYVKKFEKHSTNLQEFADKVNANIANIEIMPILNYILLKEFDENPFQRIVKNESGLIVDLGGQAPIFKNTDNGKIEEEESFIKVGVIQEVGPECKYCVPGDTVFYTKPSATPVPFYKQGLQLICENRVMAVVNEGLTERFKKNDE